MTKRSRRPISCLFVMVAAAFFVAPAFATPWTPAEWKEHGKLHNWVRDTNHNFVDDLIETQSGQMKVIVDLNQCIGDPSTSQIIQFLRTYGDITHVGKYLSFVIVAGIDRGEAVTIAARPEVAMVELAGADKWLADNYRATKVQNSAFYGTSTLEGMFGWPATLNGSGVGIAFLDTGVDNSFATAHGYNGLTNTEENPAPDPVVDHATWMASWVFGPGSLAPSASLIDIKVGDQNGVDETALLRALEKIYEKKTDWNINVITLMFSGSAQLDGREARQQMLDLLSGVGVLVVAGCGENSADVAVTGPGAATRAIGVSTADIHNTVNRADDTATFVKGPRANDGDIDQLDDLKPEVIMPSGESGTAISNSIATAMTAGLVGLVLDYNPQMADFANKASGSVKDLLIRSAENKGSADTTVAYPKAAPTWDQYWGFGEIDAFAAFTNISPSAQQGRTDLTFRGFDDTAHPSSPWYYSHAVETQSERNGDNITTGVPNKIFARILNDGPQDAERVRISFGFYPFTAGIPKFYDIGSQIINIVKNTVQEVSMDWVPPDLPDEETHGCILVTIDYGYDIRFSGGSNFAQKNIRVHDTASPAVFTFRVENTFPTKAEIRLEVRNANQDWSLTLSENKFFMEDYECARAIQATATPLVPMEPGREALFFVTAYTRPWATEVWHETGGVALKARVGKKPANQVPPTFLLLDK
ncbi:S8 family serine peptidase [Desulfoferrobacter suflitae]|uniref:S8 family serine peptidase n=1 Tax=Desulfoferrobacter suflitae TaxID=2865782 RepID=UPI002164E284|nr:S8 family serine peptidase [Desulfoferrobacter suflitae]MCK8603947.1 S8 family serine peptidase [Desulfoferrobacter suflitae]